MSKPPALPERFLARGVAVSWVAQMLQILSGFIVPRLIDRQLGADILGMWDWGWSMVSYFTLLTMGIGSTVNRYVALHRAEGDIASLNRVVSSVAMLQRGVGALIFLATLFLAWKAPLSLEAHSGEARWLILLLGSSIAVGNAGAVYGGIMTGCHRWTYFHGIFVFSNLVSLVGMWLVLALDQGLIALAAVHFGSELLGRMLRAIDAYRACPELEIRMRHANLATVKQTFQFGGKMFVGKMSAIIMNQTVSLMIGWFLGLAALALFSRPKSLVRQVAMFPQKYGNMLVPTAAALLGRQEKTEIQKFAVESMRDGLYIALPMILFLAVNGGPLLDIWMGKDYVNPMLIAILSLGFLAEIAYQPLNNILFALNFHGRPGLASALGAAGALTGVSYVLGSGHRDLNFVALAVVIPWSLAHGVFVPAYACHRLEISLWAFLKNAWSRPLACAVPFVACLFLAQWLFPSQPLLSLAVSGVSGGMVLFTLYWFWAFPERWKIKARKILSRGRGEDSNKSSQQKDTE